MAKRVAKKEAKLTPKQDMFCREYLVDLNGTQAAIRAGYSQKTANEIAAENLAKPSIQARISELVKEREKRTDITGDKVLAEIANIGFANIADYMTWGPLGVVWKNSDELTREQTAAIASIEFSEEETGEGEKTRVSRMYRFKFHDKNSALDKLCKHLSLYKEKIEFTGTLTLLEHLRDRALGSQVKDKHIENNEALAGVKR